LGMGRLKRMTKGSGEGKVTDTKARMEQWTSPIQAKMDSIPGGERQEEWEDIVHSFKIQTTAKSPFSQYGKELKGWKGGREDEEMTIGQMDKKDGRVEYNSLD
jgi:hypothetical protein